jgi:hypothetical protein
MKPHILEAVAKDENTVTPFLNLKTIKPTAKKKSTVKQAARKKKAVRA